MTAGFLVVCARAPERAKYSESSEEFLSSPGLTSLHPIQATGAPHRAQTNNAHVLTQQSFAG